ncbi:DEKNAAC100298 [Brettanomyces naardenensis]|uniref:DEKNAAC100298 n=1 Tax=Brettanomyces naardenensis TaxID=13370 RepID=A0A448YG25_BRENA|nr:DEKNAAC100298 [Brettanomyces naardenensis]
MPTHKTVGGRFNVIAIGLVAGFSVGIYLLKDYQLIKVSPPNPENFDEEGNWKHNSFIKVTVSDHVAPLDLKPDAKKKVLDGMKERKSRIKDE